MLVDPINADLPSCPPEIGHNKHVAFPSLVFIFLSLAFTSATYGIIVLLKFNSVKVFKRIIHRDEISNSYWILLMGVYFLENVLQAIKYALGNTKGEILVVIFTTVVAAAQSAGCLCLSLALLHQLRWRSHSSIWRAEEASKAGVVVHRSSSSSQRSSDGLSAAETLNSSLKPSINQPKASREGDWEASIRELRSPPPPVASRVYVSETTPFFLRGPKSSSLWRKTCTFVFSWEMLLCTLVVSYIAVLIVTAALKNVPELLYATAALDIAQHLPPIIMMLAIAFRNISTSFDSEKTSGPLFAVRIILFLAIILHLILDIPMYYWAMAVGKHGCVLHILSAVDIIIASGNITYTLMFLFIILEFRRNVEACIWGTTFHPNS